MGLGDYGHNPAIMAMTFRGARRPVLQMTLLVSSMPPCQKR